MNSLVIAKSRGLEDHGAGLRAQHGQATVNDDSLVGRKTDHRARLYDDLIGHAEGVGAGEGLRARPGGLGATLRFLNRLLRLPTKLCWGGGVHRQRKEKQQDEAQGRPHRGSLVHTPKQTAVLLQRSPPM